MKKSISIATLICLVSFSAMASGPDAHPCGNFKKEIPKDWYQGTVTVPENPDDQNSKPIEVFYFGNIQKDKTPVVFFNGGPGQHSHDAMNILQRAQRIFDAKKSLSFIFIDQRGTGCSDFYPQGSSDAVLRRLSYYGSRGIVADAEAIRKKHYGTRPWVIFGQSYGAHIVHKYVTLFPSSVKAAFGHGNSLNTSPFDRLKFRIAGQMRVMDEYLKLYPEDIKPLGILAQELELDVCYSYGVRKDKKACGWEITEDFVSSFLGSSMNWPKMHQWLNAVTDEETINKSNLQNYVETFFEEENEVWSKRWASRVISWVDRNTAPYDRRHCSFIQLELSMEEIELEGHAYTECSSILQDPKSNFDNWGRKMVKFLPQDTLTIESFKRVMKSNLRLRFYLYSGQLDPFVPVESFTEELKEMEGVQNFIYRNFTSSGHEGYQTEGKIWRDLIKEVSIQ